MRHSDKKGDRVSFEVCVFKGQNQWPVTRNNRNVDPDVKKIIFRLDRTFLVEVGCLGYPRASTFGSQPQDWITPHGWPNAATQPWAPTNKKQKRAPVTLKNRGKKREGGGRAIWWLLLATLADRNSTHCQTYATWVKHCTVVEVLKKTDFWPWVLLVLFAVNYKIAFKYIIKYYITALDTLAC